MTKKYISL